MTRADPEAEWEPNVRRGYPHLMLAANVWHWWIGVALTGVGIAVSAGLIGAYVKSVTAQKYPNGKPRKQADL